MTRVVLLGDPSKDLGAIAEPECRRILAALDLAQDKERSAGVVPDFRGRQDLHGKRRGEHGLDCPCPAAADRVHPGGRRSESDRQRHQRRRQPYWNAEATMLMHTRGILVMTPKAAMVLTGKRALDYSGSVSAEDNQGIGGYDRIMGLNGQAQYWARDIDEACHILLRHYDHTYVAPGERFPRRAATTDPIDRDVRSYPHGKNWRRGFRHSRRDFVRRDQSREEEGLRHPQGDDGGHRPGPCAAGALGWHARGRNRRGLGRASRRLSGLPDRH